MMTQGYMGGGCSSCGGVPGPAPAGGPAPVTPAPGGAQLSVPATSMYNPAPMMMQGTPAVMMDAQTRWRCPSADQTQAAIAKVFAVSDRATGS